MRDETGADEALLARALTHFHAGELAQASALCEQALAVEPNHAGMLLLLGSVALQRGDSVQARDLFLRAAEADPESVSGTVAMGLTLRHSGRLAEAAVSFRRATEITPDDPSLWTLLRETLVALNRRAEAKECDRQLARIRGAAASRQSSHRQPQRRPREPLSLQSPSPQSTHPQRKAIQPFIQPIIQRSPALPELLRSGRTLIAQERIPQAEAVFRQAVALQPDTALALHGLGYTLMRQERYDEAILHLQKAVAIMPNLTDSLHNLVQGLLHTKRYAEAEAYARQQVAAEPQASRAHQGLGSALFQLRRMAEAEERFRAALALDPKDADASNSLGMLASHHGRYAEALAYHYRALEARPDFPFGRANLGVLQLLHGDFAQGWPNYEHRLLLPGISVSLLRGRCPYWDGSPLAGKTILILAEQGIGDCIHFARYLPLLKAQGARIKFIGPQALRSSFDSLHCIDEWYDMEEEGRIAGVDTYSALLSLPYLFGTRLETIPAAVPYIQPGEERRRRWEEQLAGYRGLRVGLVWAGNPDFVNDRERSCRLTRFLPLFAVPGVNLFSLQKGDYATVQIGDLPSGSRLIDLSGELDTLDDTAAAICALDLVISVDTAVAHLAGALSRPVWTLIPFAPDWRWLLNREDTPWYPTMRLFRQTSNGDWDTVLHQVATAMAGLCG